MTCGTACDLNGDGRKEIIMGNIYGYAQIFSADGKSPAREIIAGCADGSVLALQVVGR